MPRALVAWMLVAICVSGLVPLLVADPPRQVARIVMKSYKVALGGQPVGAEDRQGDHQTPEGIYSVDRRIPNSQFHKALHISYPSAADREHAQKVGVQPGGNVEIHGLGAKWGCVGSQHRLKDWTDGCIAVTNEGIDEIWPLVRTGTVVEIRP